MKWAFYIGAPIIAIVWYFTLQDSNIELSKSFVKNNTEITRQIGTITDITLFEARYVDYAIDLNNNYKHGYNIYRYKVTGEKGSFVVNVRADKSEKGIRDVFMLKSIKSY